jgi:hypothetical protein
MNDFGPHQNRDLHAIFRRACIGLALGVVLINEFKDPLQVADNLIASYVQDTGGTFQDHLDKATAQHKMTLNGAPGFGGTPG